MVTVQRAFRAKYLKEPSTDKTIRAWYKQFNETGCLCKQKSGGRPLTAEELEYRIDVCRFTRGAHIEYFHLSKKKKILSFPVAVNNSIKVGPLVFLLYMFVIVGPVTQSV